ncbi:MAG: DNA replication/repair protein RecF [Hyphomicrobiaceae bacterium]
MREALRRGPAVTHVERLKLHNFRNYQSLALDLSPGPVVLSGPNGSGKTNLLEALSLLAPGQGLRRAPYAELGNVRGGRDWSVAATVSTATGRVSIGTGLGRGAESGGPQGRVVRIDGETRSPSALAELVELVWLTPAMDGLFTGPASDRRRFLDRLVVCFDPEHRTRLNRFERAMRQRNRLLDEPRARSGEFDGLELLMAEAAVAIAAARVTAVEGLGRRIAARAAADPGSPFPWAEIALEGRLEQMLAASPALEVEDRYQALLAGMRQRDRAAGRTLEGPHLSDLLVGHGPKEMPARLSSTGEQKALLIGLVLAHAELVADGQGRGPPILLLDEIAAHLDDRRRAALFAAILGLGAQAFMTGTDELPFAALRNRAQFLHVSEGIVSLSTGT